MTYRRITDTEIAEWATWYEQGYSLRQIAARARRDHKQIQARIRAAGVQARSVGRYQSTVIGWCDECCDTRILNPITGWCADCTNLPRRSKSQSDQSTKVQA